MNILISFCNTMDTPGFPNLGVIDTRTKEFFVFALPESIALTGMLGLAMTEKYLLVGHQHTQLGPEGYQSPAAIVILDRYSGQLIHHHPLQRVRDIHSFLWREAEQHLYVVSTGTDEVIRLSLHKEKLIHEEIVWTAVPETTNRDTRHINSIFQWQGEIYVSGFGPRDIDGEWGSAHDGFIQNITSGQRIIGSLEQPHSIDVIRERMAFCESRMKRFRFVDGMTGPVELPGYTRGLCHSEDFIWIGTSASRKKSKSTGRALTITPDQPGGCTITQLNHELEVIHAWDLADVGIEIYELMVVDDVSGWPLIKPQNYRASYMQSWDYKAQSALREIRSCVQDADILILVDDNLLSAHHHMLAPNRVLPFLERDGVYWGPPENDDVAIRELQRMCKNGAAYIAFTWSSFWWLTQYKGFSEFLSTNFHKRHESSDAILFSLK